DKIYNTKLIFEFLELPLSINANESVSMIYKDSVFVLPKGRESKIVTSRLDTIGTAIVLFTTTERITNYGLQLKSKIQKWPNN
ncbi:MAG: hypothetical protein QME58_14495, partial [Bacteroidota bacterium]|nr:hypothetical protein [Bacteroidota bacterium]